MDSTSTSAPAAATAPAGANRAGRPLAPLARRPTSRTAASRLAAVDRPGRAGRGLGRHVDRIGRMAVRAGGHGAVRRDVSLAGHDQHRAAGVLQPDDDAIHALLRRADHRRRHAYLARPAGLDRRLWSARSDRRHLALQRRRRRGAVGGRDSRPSAGRGQSFRCWATSRPKRCSCGCWASRFSCWRSCR